jgi:hypothetical protein
MAAFPRLVYLSNVAEVHWHHPAEYDEIGTK